ncbi:hypothetical protein B0T10DRAFT_467443 [Thelonectria olida]|uniref:Uncharacterized protein n=1 Tax=Thelonectria olida TaxID=1576542 RepID=A0A9P8VNG9_9HYPO|nr:hypothetical protein B0T10DRAFT_467443 [Thelonectria olida]
MTKSYRNPGTSLLAVPPSDQRAEHRLKSINRTVDLDPVTMVGMNTNVVVPVERYRFSRHGLILNRAKQELLVKSNHLDGPTCLSLLSNHLPERTPDVVEKLVLRSEGFEYIGPCRLLTGGEEQDHADNVTKFLVADRFTDPNDDKTHFQQQKAHSAAIPDHDILLRKALGAVEDASQQPFNKWNNQNLPRRRSSRRRDNSRHRPHIPKPINALDKVQIFSFRPTDDRKHWSFSATVSRLQIGIWGTERACLVVVDVSIEKPRLVNNFNLSLWFVARDSIEHQVASQINRCGPRHLRGKVVDVHNTKDTGYGFGGNAVINI